MAHWKDANLEGSFLTKKSLRMPRSEMVPYRKRGALNATVLYRWPEHCDSQFMRVQQCCTSLWVQQTRYSVPVTCEVLVNQEIRLKKAFGKEFDKVFGKAD